MNLCFVVTTVVNEQFDMNPLLLNKRPVPWGDRSFGIFGAFLRRHTNQSPRMNEEHKENSDSLTPGSQSLYLIGIHVLHITFQYSPKQKIRQIACTHYKTHLSSCKF